ncbi:MAG TPA: porin family protein [Flavitalea sp.]|nr:porin family protein [Flavitalea sp.]
MKTKSLSLLTLAIAFASISFAQGLHVGVKGGVNLLKIDGKSFNEEFRHGYNFGGFAEINFNDKWGIQPEVLFNQANTRTSTHFNDIYDEGVRELKDVKLNYLSMPLLLNFKPSKLLTIQAGPQFGILLNKDQSLLSNGKEAFKRGDFAMLAGAQLNFGGIKVGGRYAVGLYNINDIDNRDKWKNQGFQLYAGFRIF